MTSTGARTDAAQRFVSGRGHLGFLVFHEVKGKERLFRRCGDVLESQRWGLVLPLDDEDLRALAAAGADPRTGRAQYDFLAARETTVRTA